MTTAIFVSLFKRFIVTGTVTIGQKVIPVNTYTGGYTEDEACADAAWGVGLRELRGTGVMLTEEMYTYNLTATENQSL